MGWSECPGCGRRGADFYRQAEAAWDPIIVHMPTSHVRNLVVEGPERRGAKRYEFDEAFWPGPLTLLLPARPQFGCVTAGRPLVGISHAGPSGGAGTDSACRVPWPRPVQSLRAHRPTTAAHVLCDLDGRIDAYWMGFDRARVESTVLDSCQSPMVIYRPGAVTAEQIREAGGAVEVFRTPREISEKPKEALPSPD